MKRKYLKSDYAVRTLCLLLKQQRNKATHYINELIEMIVTPDDFNRAIKNLRETL